MDGAVFTLAARVSYFTALASFAVIKVLHFNPGERLI